LILRENVLHEHVNGYTTILPFVIFIAFFVIYTHRKNVVKIFNGTENKLNFKEKQKS
jgi:glycerol-3-phosphate acyltransferase PlsY